MINAIRRITPSEYGEAQALWDMCFPEDAHGYSAYYFKERTSPENVYALYASRRMVCALHAIDYPLVFAGQKKRCAMIAGVATLPEHRKKGYASELIRYVHGELASSGVVAAALKPDVDFYAKFGYLPFAYHDEYRLRACDAKPFASRGMYTPDAVELLRIYDGFAANYQGMMSRTVRDMQLYAEEAMLSGKVFGNGKAYAFCSPSDDGVDITELVGEEPVALAAELALKYAEATFRLPRGMKVENIRPNGRMMFSMLCPLDAEALLANTGISDIKALLGGEYGECCTLEFC